jgi:hypothetical protein
VIALNKLRAAGPVRAEIADGYAFALSAAQDAREYVCDAPPDGMRMLQACYLAPCVARLVNLPEFIVPVQVRGSPRSLALFLGLHARLTHERVVQAAIDAQHIAEVVAGAVGVKVADTQMRLIAELFRTRTHPAGLQWDSITSSTFEASDYAGLRRPLRARSLRGSKTAGATGHTSACRRRTRQTCSFTGAGGV